MAARIDRIEVPTPFRVGPVNCWLVRGDDATALFDAGPNDPPSLSALEAALDGHGLSPGDLDLVVLTHQHFDHVGLAATLQERWGAQVAALEPLAAFLRDGHASNVAEDEYAVDVMRLHGVPEDVVATLWEQAGSRWPLGCACTVDRVLHDGEVLDLGGAALRVLHRPGHSPTDTIFADESAGEAIVGDHLIAHISSNPVIHRPLDGTADARQRPRTLVRYLDSMHRTAALGLARCLSGHGRPVSDPAQLVALRRREHDARKEEIFAATAGGPLTAYELTSHLWSRLPVDQVYLGICEVLGHVDLLVDEGRATEVETGGVVRIARS